MSYGLVQRPMAPSYVLWPCPMSYGLSFVPCCVPNLHEIVRGKAKWQTDHVKPDGIARRTIDRPKLKAISRKLRVVTRPPSHNGCMSQ